MLFPLIYLLYIYAFLVLAALLFLFFNVYHLAQFGLEGGKTYTFIALYLISFLGVLALSLLLLLTVDWSASVDMTVLFMELISPPQNTTSSL